jgi:hypothetical protein
MPRYPISGLHVSSELELPGAILEPSKAATADIAIRRAPVPMVLDGAAASGPAWEMRGKTFLLRVPQLARFQITAGCDVAVETEPGVTDRDAAGFVLGAAFDILLYQRGALVIHGAEVARYGRAIAICGRGQIDAGRRATPRAASSICRIHSPGCARFGIRSTNEGATFEFCTPAAALSMLEDCRLGADFKNLQSYFVKNS